MTYIDNIKFENYNMLGAQAAAESISLFYRNRYHNCLDC